MSKRETILQAITARLATIPAVAGRVFRNREDALAIAESPSIVVRPETEDTNELTNGLVECQLQVSVDIFQRGNGINSSPDTLVDGVLESAHALLLADPQLGGLCIDMIDQATFFDFEGGDEISAMITTRYRVWYRRPRATMG